MRTRSRWYVGLNSSKDRYEPFMFRSTPTESSHGSKYRYVIGPFTTKAGAFVMAAYGRNNPHLGWVGDAERIAKRHPEMVDDALRFFSGIFTGLRS